MIVERLAAPAHEYEVRQRSRRSKVHPGLTVGDESTEDLYRCPVCRSENLRLEHGVWQRCDRYPVWVVRYGNTLSITDTKPEEVDADL